MIMPRNSKSSHNPTALPDGLRELIGLQLSSVEFVQDYIQLHFDGPTLTAYTWPTVSKGSSVLSRGQSGYRDAICEPIGRLISQIEFQPESFGLVFDNKTIVRISLRDEDYRGPEAIQLSLSDYRTWVI